MNELIFRYFNNLAGKSVCFDSIVVFCAQYLPYIVVLGFLLLLIFSKQTTKEKLRIFIFTAFAVILARLLITEAIRYFYHHQRPFAVLADVNQIINHSANWSLPSGHAAFFFALAVAIMLATRWRTWSMVFFIAAIIIGLARIIAGLHWPLDIFSGTIVGILSSYVVHFSFKKYLQKSPE